MRMRFGFTQRANFCWHVRRARVRAVLPEVLPRCAELFYLTVRLVCTSIVTLDGPRASFCLHAIG